MNRTVTIPTSPLLGGPTTTLRTRESFAFRAGDQALEIATGRAVKIMMIDCYDGEPRPYIVAADPECAEQHRVAEDGLAPLTPTDVAWFIRQSCRFLVGRRQTLDQNRREHERLANLKAVRSTLA